MSLQALAMEHQQKRDELSGRVARRAARLWQNVRVGDLDSGWDRVAPQLEQVVTGGQFQAAQMASGFTAAAFAAQDMSGGSGRVVPGAFTGATLEGRAVLPELFSAVTLTKSLIGRGTGVGAAFHSGTALLTVLAATMVRDAGNMADKVSSVNRGAVQMARVVSPGACSRCAILAGVGHFTRHFERHPGCRCTTVPVRSADDLPDGVFASAGDYFNSLSKAEQDRVFTKAGAEAIRLGASEASVVNARRGMFRTRQPGSMVARATPREIIGPDGKPFMAYTTSEGTTKRGYFGGGYGGSKPGTEYVKRASDRYRRTTTVRLMPETILQLAKSREEAVTLLRQFGYLY